MDALEPGKEDCIVTVKVSDLMAEQVVTAEPHQTVEHVRRVIERNRIHAVPVLDSDGRPIGIVSLTDLNAAGLKDGTPVSQVMTEKVYTVPLYEKVSIAARVMRNHQIHRVVVTHEGKVEGMLSAFDLLALVEEHRFVMKNPPTPKKRGGNERS
ncbi:MAG: CBS domain-containing protein [Myxococcota bacterium]